MDRNCRHCCDTGSADKVRGDGERGDVGAAGHTSVSGLAVVCREGKVLRDPQHTVLSYSYPQHDGVRHNGACYGALKKKAVSVHKIT